MSVTEVLPVVSKLPADADPVAFAEAAGLVYIAEDEPGFTRVKSGRGFSYRDLDGETIPDGEVRERIKALVIPPAWSEVWISPDDTGHIQATGRDDADRKQYLYHDLWRQIRDATKFHRMQAFGALLPGIRDAVDGHLRKRSLSREKVLALVVGLLDETLVRIGNEEYTRTNGAHGLTTFRDEHVEVSGSVIRFTYPAKGGQERDFSVTHPRLARQLLKCEEIPGQRLFGFQVDDSDDWRMVDSGAVNAYLREIAGERVTAKDFRTWGGTVVAATTLHELGPAEDAKEAESNIIAAVDAAAERLGNTRTVARASYVDPRVPKAYRFDRFEECWDNSAEIKNRLSPAERAVRRVLDLDLPRSSDLEATLQASLDKAAQAAKAAKAAKATKKG